MNRIAKPLEISAHADCRWLRAADDRRQPAFEGINQGERCDDRNGCDFARPERNRNHDRYGVDTHTFRGRTSQQKERRSYRSQMRSEALFDQLVSRIKIAAKILRK